MYKNNTVLRSLFWFCHENYLVRRGVSRYVRTLLYSVLTSRIIYAGSGAVRGKSFLFLSVVIFLDDTISSATTRSSPHGPPR